MVEVKDIKLIGKRDKFTVVTGGVEIYDCEYVSGEKDGKKYEFVATPQRSYTDKAGVVKYVKVVNLSKEVAEAAKTAYKAKKAEEATEGYEDEAPPF